MNDSGASRGYGQKDWQAHYDADDLRWDLGQVSPPLRQLLDQGFFKPGRMLIPGCGQGHEVVFFSGRLFDVTGVDFAPGAVKLLADTLRKRGLQARVLNLNFFELDDSHTSLYDWVLEQTFFCAIHPDDRPRYVETVHRVLKPGGSLAGLFYETGEDGGPPFNTSREDILTHFSEGFDIDRLEPCDHSIDRRQGKEWLAVLRKKEGAA